MVYILIERLKIMIFKNSKSVAKLRKFKIRGIIF